MASTIDEIEPLLRSALVTGYRGRLLERGMARSMIWNDGVLPDDAPVFAASLSYDLFSYGYSLLSLALRLRELGGDETLYREAFEKAASAISDVIKNGDPNDPEHGFHKVLSAASYHLGRFSAKAYSLLHHNIENENLSRMESMLCLLILRRFEDLDAAVMTWKFSGAGSDHAIVQKINADIDDIDLDNEELDEDADFGVNSVELPAVDLAINDNYMSSLSEFLLALETGNQILKDNAVNRINICLSASAELNMLPQWWVLRITMFLIDDLWESCFHSIIPVTPQHENGEEWAKLRWLFIASLFKRSKAEIDLWPSQLEGANRAVNDFDNLVVSLPTSAGKTRVAELCILRCLALSKRVLFITPLRALSAQTETSLRKTFQPLDKSISSLYGSIGTSDFEQDVLKSRDIVVGTPEKLDFALRNYPSLIDDVGLVVLDEGHMIGLNEREISYEVQIQRLLQREDADQRRIVCLSAILPDGDQFEDFVNWLRRDMEGGAIVSNWRPTDLRFGEIVWQGQSAKIDFTIGEERPFLPNFVQPFVPPIGGRRIPFPKNNKELTLATAWKLVEDNHTVLIYCPLKTSVNSFAKDIVDLNNRGAIGSVLNVPMNQLALAITLGNEWLGDNHPIVKCLKIGVAVHHGNLPTPFRKEMENLLREGILKVTVSSPTLAQGLNLSATAVIVYSLYRNRKIIDPSEFKNVIGRAGRAFVDMQGIVLYPIYEDRYGNERTKWRNLVENTNARSMESGLVLLVMTLLNRMGASIGSTDIDTLIQYVLNNAHVWEFPAINNEAPEQAEQNQNNWQKHIVSLDTALLSLLGSDVDDINDIPAALDTILSSSLWTRRLARHGAELKALCDSVLTQRARYIWSVSTPLQRKGYFLAGVGLETGQKLDAISPTVNVVLVEANGAILNGDNETSISKIVELAEHMFSISPFTPDVLPDNWKEIISVWLNGKALTEENITNIDEALQFVEDGLIYRLPWGLEAIRVRAGANGDRFTNGMALDDYETGLLVPAIENGTLNRSAALLMQAGFNSRKAAIIAVESTGATFSNGHQLKEWIDSDAVFDLALLEEWPTPETSDLWWDFVKSYQASSEAVWSSTLTQIPVSWQQGFTPVAGTQMKIWNNEATLTHILSSEGEHVGFLNAKYSLCSNGIYHTRVNGNPSYIDITYCGPSPSPFNIIAND
jgi:superfamily II DNA/RNA helicase